MILQDSCAKLGILIVVISSCVGQAAAVANEFVRRPATIIGLRQETFTETKRYWVRFHVEPKTRARDAKPYDTELVVASAKIFSVSPTGHRRERTRDALVPGMRVLVSGYESISSPSSATAIVILEAAQ
jgi:hypothetical protein